MSAESMKELQRELDVLVAVIKELEPLSDEVRRRLLNAVESFFGVGN